MLKKKYLPGDIIILHKCTKNHIIWYTVPDRRDRLFLIDVLDAHDRRTIVVFHFELFFALLLP